MSKQVKVLMHQEKTAKPPSVTSINTFHVLDHFSNRSLKDTSDLLGEYVEKVKMGDLSVVEEILTIQFFTLSALFNKHAEVGAEFAHTKEGTRILRLALKAQNQCRAIAETLASIKHPKRTTFVKQANIGHNQQVNNLS